MVIGSWGGLVFEVSDNKILTTPALSRSIQANLAEHATPEPLTEFTGRGAETISFDVSLRGDLGVNPRVESERVFEYCRTGARYPLLLGRETVGGPGALWICESASDVQEIIDGFGNVLKSLLSISLRLAPDPPVVAASATVAKKLVQRKKVS